MAHSSPEGIILGKGSKLESLDLSINQEKVLAIKQQERNYSDEEVVKILYQFHYDLVNSNFDTKEEWFGQFKKK